MNLRGKQKRFLRAQANHLQPIFAVGKEGLTQNRRELIKVNILQNSDVTPKEVQHFIESQTEIQVVQIIGRVLVLFKVSANKDARELSSRVKKI